MVRQKEKTVITIERYRRTVVRKSHNVTQLREEGELDNQPVLVCGDCGKHLLADRDACGDSPPAASEIENSSE